MTKPRGRHDYTLPARKPVVSKVSARTGMPLARSEPKVMSPFAMLPRRSRAPVSLAKIGMPKED